MMKNMIVPAVVLLFSAAAAALVWNYRDRNDPERTAMMQQELQAYPGCSFSLDEDEVVLKRRYADGCVGMGTHGASDCRETFVACLKETPECQDRYKLESQYPYTVYEYDYSFKIVMPKTYSGTEQHRQMVGANIQPPERNLINNIRRMAQEAYRTFPVAGK